MADFSRAKLGRPDLRSSDIRGAHWDFSQLAGATISYEQAADLVQAAGICVR